MGMFFIALIRIGLKIYTVTRTHIYIHRKSTEQIESQQSRIYELEDELEGTTKLDAMYSARLCTYLSVFWRDSM